MAIGAVLSGGVGLIQAMMHARAQAQANAINQQSVNETKRSNRVTEKMAKSARTDASGNRLSYDPLGNEWLTELTPMIEATLGRQEAETLLSLLEDAPRNRAAAERQDNRSQQADDAFSKAMLDYQYRTPRSEDAAVGEHQQQLLRDRREGLSEASNLLAKQAIRGGNSNDIASFFKTADDMFAGSLDDAMFQGAERGRASFREAEAADQNTMLQALQTFAGLAGDTTVSPIGSTNAVESFTGQAENALSNLINVTGSNSSRLTQAMSQLAQGVGNSFPDLGPVAAALAQINFGGGQGGTTRTQHRLRADVA